MDGSVAGQKLQPGQRTPTHGVKGTGKPNGQKAVCCQKGQPIKQAPAKAAAATKNVKKTKKGKHHQHDLIVTINLVSRKRIESVGPTRNYSIFSVNKFNKRFILKFLKDAVQRLHLLKRI